MKIVLGVVAGLIVVCLAILGGVAYCGYQVYHNMQVAAQDTYGGPLPHHVLAIMGFKMAPYKVGTYVDTHTRMTMEIAEQPLRTQGKDAAALAKTHNNDIDETFSELADSNSKATVVNNVSQQDSDFGHDFTTGFVRAMAEKVQHGKVDHIQVGSMTVPTMVAQGEDGYYHEAGVLNLAHRQIIFEGGSRHPEHLANNITQFLMEMPVVQQGMSATKSMPEKQSMPTS